MASAPHEGTTNAVDSRDEDLATRKAVRWFWVVLVGATLISVSGNAFHAWFNATSVPPVGAAAVATVPPLVLLASCEGIRLLIRARKLSSAANIMTLAVTTLLAVVAFVLSFDALRDLAMRFGVRHSLAWLWPIAVDATIAQATMALLTLSRRAPETAASMTSSEVLLDELDDEPISDLSEDSRSRIGDTAAALIRAGVTTLPLPVVATMLEQNAAGRSPAQIADHIGGHRSTVTRLLKRFQAHDVYAQALAGTG